MPRKLVLHGLRLKPIATDCYLGERVKHLYVFDIVCVAAVAKLGIAADSYLSVAQRIISRSRVQIPPAAFSYYALLYARFKTA
jgi:hypothetical protein